MRHFHRGQPHLRGEIADVYTWAMISLSWGELQELLQLGVQSIKSEADTNARQLHGLCAAALDGYTLDGSNTVLRVGLSLYPDWFSAESAP